MPAGMGRETADRGLHLTEPGKKSGIIPGEIPGMPDRPGFRAKQEGAVVRQSLKAVLQFRQKRNGAQTSERLGLMFHHRGNAVLQNTERFTVNVW